MQGPIVPKKSHSPNTNISMGLFISFICCTLSIVINFNLMKQRLRATTNKIEHITHLLNTSSAKLAYSFKGAQRFHLNKSLSPDKFYDLPSSLGRRSCSFGIGQRHSLEKVDCTQPARYRIPSQFDIKKQTGGRGAFGISREEYYRGKAQKQTLGPGAYNLKDPIQNKRFYIGRRVQSAKDKHDPSSCSYAVKGQTYNKLSTYRKNDAAVRMKTQYFPKHPLQTHDNKVPGPGSYTQRSNLTHNSGSYSQQRRKTNSSFGVSQRSKQPRQTTLGPGAYNSFSEFGNNF